MSEYYCRSRPLTQLSEYISLIKYAWAICLLIICFPEKSQWRFGPLYILCQITYGRCRSVRHKIPQGAKLTLPAKVNERHCCCYCEPLLKEDLLPFPWFKRLHTLSCTVSLSQSKRFIWEWMLKCTDTCMLEKHELKRITSNPPSVMFVLCCDVPHMALHIVRDNANFVYPQTLLRS